MTNISDIFEPLLHKYRDLRESLGPYASGSGLNNLDNLSVDHKISVVQKLQELKDIEDEISYKLSDYYVLVSELGTNFPGWSRSKYDTADNMVKSTVLMSIDMAIPYPNEPLWLSTKNNLSIKIDSNVPSGMTQKIKSIMRQDISSFGFLAGLRFLFLGNYFNSYSPDNKMCLFIKHKDEISLVDFISFSFDKIKEQYIRKISDGYSLKFEEDYIKPIKISLDNELGETIFNNVELLKKGLTEGFVSHKMPSFFNGFLSNESNWIEITQNLAKIELARSLDISLKTENTSESKGKI